MITITTNSSISVKPSLDARRRRKRSIWFSLEDNIGLLVIATNFRPAYPTTGDSDAQRVTQRGGSLE